ncbi:MAG: universal stress protein, partial [Candidatus Promineofilum sp.]|nr:universal stress protein [Promineifilum sp.]
ARLHAEIEGLFVEDIILLRLAELPFAREIRFGQAGARQVEAEALRRNLRARAAVLRRELEEIATENHLSTTFRVAQGAVAEEVLTAAREVDLLALGRLGHSLAQRVRLGSTARAAIARAASAVLLVQPVVASGPVVVLYDGSAAGARALALAAQVSGETSELRVLVWAPDEETAFERRQLAAHVLSARQADTQYQHLADGDAPRVLAWVNRQGGSLLIIPAAEGDWPEGTQAALLDEAQPHLLLIR